jgi:hypothetical protein
VRFKADISQTNQYLIDAQSGSRESSSSID